MTDPIRSAGDVHEEAEMLLPWYVTGQLDELDRSRVDRHLASCAPCQMQVRLERGLAEEVRGLVPEVELGWTEIRRQLGVGRSRWTKIARWAEEAWRALSRPAVAGLAAAQVAFLLVAAGLMLSIDRAPYRALGTPQAAATANVIIVFGPEATEVQFRRALLASGARLVGGPTSADAYLLRVPDDRRQAALAKLRAAPGVSLAEPIDGVSQ